MEREEAIDIIKNYDVNDCGYCHQGGDEVEEAFNIAIKALEQEPCEDVISRQTAIDEGGKMNGTERTDRPNP